MVQKLEIVKKRRFIACYFVPEGRKPIVLFDKRVN
jgi:hypothetical protein